MAGPSVAYKVRSRRPVVQIRRAAGPIDRDASCSVNLEATSVGALPACNAAAKGEIGLVTAGDGGLPDSLLLLQRLPLGHDELLAQQCVLCHERSPSAEQIGGESCQEPHEIVHAAATACGLAGRGCVCKTP